MKHYTYQIVNPQTGEFYYGVRTCRTEIAEDYRYMGSSRHLKARLAMEPGQWKKIVLQEHVTREEAESREYDLTSIETLRNPLCINRARGGGGWRLMVPRGPMSAEQKEKIGAAQRGKSKNKVKAEPRKKMELTSDEKERRALHFAEIGRAAGAARKGKPMSEEHKAKLKGPRGPNVRTTGR